MEPIKSDALTLGGNDANQAGSPETVARIHGCQVTEVTEPQKGFHKRLVRFVLFCPYRRMASGSLRITTLQIFLQHI